MSFLYPVDLLNEFIKKKTFFSFLFFSFVLFDNSLFFSYENELLRCIIESNGDREKKTQQHHNNCELLQLLLYTYKKKTFGYMEVLNYVYEQMYRTRLTIRSKTLIIDYSQLLH